jgi:cold-inducible RNA-binding protein
LLENRRIALEFESGSGLRYIAKPVLAISFFSIPHLAGKEQNKMSMKLYVGNISFNTTNQDLNDLFGTIGTVESANIIEDRETGRSRGFGFVEMASEADGQNAIAQLDGKEVDGRALKVNEAKPQQNRSGGGGGGGRGRDRGGYGGGGGGGGGYGGRSW